MDKDPQLLAKVEPDRREFLKRLSLAAAYATPVVSSFSFDGLLRAARAQNGYVGARVVDVVFVPGAGAGGLIVSRVAQATDPWGTVRITYSKPMQTSLNSCKRVTGDPCGDGDCWVDSKLDVIPLSVSGCDPVDLSGGWTWPDDTTEERDVYTQVSRIDLQLNTPELGCSGEDSYRAQDGYLLEPYVGALDTSEYCPIIIESKIDTLSLWPG